MIPSTDSFKGTPLENVDLSPLLELSCDCNEAVERSYFVQPVYASVADKVMLGYGVGFKSCCAGNVTAEAYVSWLPLLVGVVGFLTTEIKLQNDEH